MQPQQRKPPFGGHLLTFLRPQTRVKGSDGQLGFTWKKNFYLNHACSSTPQVNKESSELTPPCRPWAFNVSPSDVRELQPLSFYCARHPKAHRSSVWAEAGSPFAGVHTLVVVTSRDPWSGILAPEINKKDDCCSLCSPFHFPSTFALFFCDL